MKNEKINCLKKFYNDLLRDAQQEFKKDTCLYCGKKTTSFCNSHSVPSFILRNIAIDGKVYSSFAFDDIVISEQNPGVNRTGTFKLICRDCDNSIFKIYENENVLLKRPSNEILKAIKLKAMLKDYSTKGIYKIFYQKFYEAIKFDNCLFNKTDNWLKNPGLNAVNKFDEIEYKDFLLTNITMQLEMHKRDEKELVKKIDYILNNEENYNLIFWKILEYKVPIACQTSIVIYGDLKGNLVNDVYDYSDDLEMEELYLVVFPLKEKSVIILFYPEYNTKIDKFAEQFNQKNEAEKLIIINFMLFLYSEDFYMAPQIDRNILKNSSCRSLKSNFMNIEVIVENNNFTEVEKDKKTNLEMLKKLKPKIPCLLFERYRIE